MIKASIEDRRQVQQVRRDMTSCMHGRGILPSQTPQTRDVRDYVVYASYAAMGAGGASTSCCLVAHVIRRPVLLPWNATLSALDYYTSIYPGWHADRLLPICYLPCMLVPLGITSLLHHHLNKHTRVVLGFSLFCATIAAPMMCQLAAIGPTGQGTPTTLAITLLSVACMGVADGIGQGALFAEAAPVPGGVPALQMGTALSGTWLTAMSPPAETCTIQMTLLHTGIVVLFLRCVTKALFHDTPAGLRASAVAYFAVAELCCLLCLAVYCLLLPRLPTVVAARARVAHSLHDAFGGALCRR